MVVTLGLGGLAANSFDRNDRNDHFAKFTKGFFLSGKEKSMTILLPGYDGCIYIGCDLSRAAYKIGRTNNPTRRQHEIRKMNPTFIIIDYLCFFAQDSYKTEKMLHALFAQKRIDGEWFNLNYDDVRKIVVEMHRQSDAACPTLNIDEDYNDYEIEQMISCKFAGEDYGDAFMKRKIVEKKWECPYCQEFCGLKCEGWVKDWQRTSRRVAK